MMSQYPSPYIYCKVEATAQKDKDLQVRILVMMYMYKVVLNDTTIGNVIQNVRP